MYSKIQYFEIGGNVELIKMVDEVKKCNIEGGRFVEISASSLICEMKSINVCYVTLEIWETGIYHAPKSRSFSLPRQKCYLMRQETESIGVALRNGSMLWLQPLRISTKYR